MFLRFSVAWPYLIILSFVLFTGQGSVFAAVIGLSVVLGLWATLRPVPFPPFVLRAAIPLGALLLVGLAGALFPAGEVMWRQEAVALGIEMRGTSNPQPWVSAFAILAIFPVLLWATLLGGATFSQTERRVLIRGVAVIGILFCAGVIVGNAMGWKLGWSDRTQMFSWFPNRNQTAIVAASVAVFCVGLFLGRDREPVWRWVWIIGSILALWAVLQTTSRGAALAIVPGLIALGVLSAMESAERRRPLLKWFPLAFVGLVLIFMIFDGRTRDRLFPVEGPLVGQSGEIETASWDFRAKVYADTLTMVREAPWVGVGAGNFAMVFPQYRNHSQLPVGVIHPESDWLWWLAEWGVLGALGIVTLLGTLLWYWWRRFRSAETVNRYGSIAASAALVVMLVHFVIDVSGHRFGTVFFALALYTIALPQIVDNGGSVGPGNDSDIRFWLTRIGGIIVLLMGGIGFYLGYGPMQRHPSLAVFEAEPVRAYPLVWEPYYRRALQRVEADPRAARADFRRARFLETVDPELPRMEALALREVAPTAALVALRAFFDRSSNPAEAVRQMMQIWRNTGRSSDAIRSLLQGDSVALGAYWQRVEREEFRHAVEAGAGGPLWVDLAILGSSDQVAVLERMNALGLHEAVISWTGAGTSRRDEVWKDRALAFAARQEWDAVLNLFGEHWALTKYPPVEPAVLNRLQGAVRSNPRELRLGVELLRGLAASKQWAEARRVADFLLSENETVPNEVYVIAVHSHWNSGNTIEAAKRASAFLAVLKKANLETGEGR